MVKMMFGNHLQWFASILLLIILAGFPAPWVFGADSGPSAVGISVKAENETLANVLEKISQDSGYEIEFDQEWGNHPVNIQFENESLEDALNRVLANLNHAVIWNDTEKKISIFINGEVSAKGTRSPIPGGGSSPVAGGSEEQSSPTGGSSLRVPTRSSDEIGDTSPPTPVRRSREQVSQSKDDLPVSVSGEKTRFGQGTSTID